MNNTYHCSRQRTIAKVLKAFYTSLPLPLLYIFYSRVKFSNFSEKHDLREKHA